MDKKMEIDLAKISVDLEYIKQNVENINRKLECQYVQRMEFDPIKRCVYGMVGIMLSALLVGLVSLVMR
jgi:hypothetical protein